MLLHLCSGATCASLSYKIGEIAISQTRWPALVCAVGFAIIATLQLTGISRRIERRLVG